MSQQESDQKDNESLPMSKKVSDGIGLFGLALMTLGACVALWRMLMGRDYSTPGQKIGMALLTAGMLWLTWYLWRTPAKPIGHHPGDAIPPAPRELPPMELRYGSRGRLTEWVLAGVVAMSIVVAVMLALAYPIVAASLWTACVIGALIVYLLLSNGRYRQNAGPVLRIDARGITDLRPPQFGLVPWADIHHLEQATLHARRQLAIWLHADSPSAAGLGWKRKLTRVGAWTDGRAGDLFIDLESLDCRPGDVEKRAIQGLTAWRYQRQLAGAGAPRGMLGLGDRDRAN